MAKVLVGRKEEIRILEECFRSSLAVYGRERGTSLIKSHFQDIFFTPSYKDK
ncbi:MAG: hypothetical protein IPO92_06670 [Saprospiraceae bacterium]|nr:hypothetical protein [Saprospiraceae bacterium]